MKINISSALDISQSSFLITGGAGFIGSNIVEHLMFHQAGFVRVLDNLSNGSYENIKPFVGKSNFEFIEGDIRDLETCKTSMKDIQYVSHQAALGSVPRSISDPITTNDVNVNGFLNVLISAKESDSVRRFVYAASSSTYGDHQGLPKVEGTEGKSLSPYAITKAVNEQYAQVFSNVYGFHSIGLRYFNIFGPRQSHNNPYAAVIPIFCNAFIHGKSPVINGDGETSRDFTYVDNAVQANMLALFHEGLGNHEVYNVACGDQVSLNDIIKALQVLSGRNIEAVYGPERLGDVRHSMASIEKISRELGYKPEVGFYEGLKNVYDWYLARS